MTAYPALAAIPDTRPPRAVYPVPPGFTLSPDFTVSPHSTERRTSYLEGCQHSGETLEAYALMQPDTGKLSYTLHIDMEEVPLSDVRLALEELTAALADFESTEKAEQARRKRLDAARASITAPDRFLAMKRAA